MEKREIIFIVQKKNQAAYAACLASIEALRLPEGYTLQTVTVSGGTDLDYTAFSEQVRRQTLARYYIYLDEELCFVNEAFLVELLGIFQSDARIGALGIAGARCLPQSGDWQQAAEKYGAYYYVAGGRALERRFAEPPGRYAEVQGLEPGLLAVQRSLPYTGQSLPGSTMRSWRLAEAAELRRAGWRLVVPGQAQPWCLYSQREPDSSVEPGWLAAYAGYLAVPHETGAIPVCLLHGFGSGSHFTAGYRLDCPQGIQIGAGVRIGRDAWLGLPYANFAGAPRIKIGDGCDLGPRCVISAVNRIVLERGVSTGENVRIADYSACCRAAGLPIHRQGAACPDGAVVIGAGTRLEAQAVVEGSIHIGRGCLIKAGSFVREDVPDYCVAEGNPARVVQILDWQKNQWHRIGDARQLAVCRNQRQAFRPLLTIGIPTYNRSAYLDRCLQHVYTAIGDDAMFEVYVSDNASTDDTAAVVRRYAARYHSLRYERNPENIGPEGNFLKVWQNARGGYVMALGDDDYLKPAVFYEIIKTLQEDRQAGILALSTWDKAFQREAGQGVDEYVKRVSYAATSISSIVYRKEDFDQVPLTAVEKYFSSSLHQLAVQLELLRINPRFVRLIGPLVPSDGSSNAGLYLTPAEHERRRRNGALGDFGKIFIKNYLDILDDYKKYGLQEDTLRIARQALLEGHILPFCRVGARRPMQWQFDTVLHWYDVYYRQDTYYAAKRAELAGILGAAAAALDRAVGNPGKEEHS